MGYNPYTGEDDTNTGVDPTDPTQRQRIGLDPNAVPDPAASGTGATPTQAPRLPTGTGTGATPSTVYAGTPETPQVYQAPATSTVDTTGATGLPPAGGFHWDPGTGPLVYPGMSLTDSNTKSLAAGRPALPTGSIPGKTSQNFGDLTNPSAWMGLVGNDASLTSWIKSIMPNASPDDVAYWAKSIKGKPGANPTEQAGSAEYWKTRMLNPGSGGESGGGSGAAMGATTGTQRVSTSDFQDPAIHQAILDLLKRGSTPLTADDPTLRAQFDPIDRQMQIGAKRAQEGAAERTAFQGTNNGGQGGALDAQGNSINEDLATSEGGLMSNMVTNELAARRQQVESALQFASGDEARALQAELADLNATVQREGLKQQNQQFYDTMGNNNGIDEYLFNQIFHQGLGQ